MAVDVLTLRISEGILAFLWAFVVAVAGYFVALFSERLVSLIYRRLGIKEFMTKAGYERAVVGIEMEKLLREVVKWWVFLVFLVQATSILSLYTITDFFRMLLSAYMQIVVAVLYFAVGAIVAHYVGEKVKESGVVGGNLTALAVKGVILYVSLVTALQVVGFSGINFLNRIVELLVAAFVVAFGLAVGISFGLGAKDLIKEMLEEEKEKVKEKVKGLVNK